MQETLIIRGRNIITSDIGLIRSLVDEYNDRSRNFIAKKLSERWCWYQPNGRLKGRACRDILTQLEKKGLIDLPPLRATKGSRKNKFTFLALRFKLGLVAFKKQKAQ